MGDQKHAREDASGNAAEGGGETGSTVDALRSEPHLEIYEKHSILMSAGSEVKTVWPEGKQTPETIKRYQAIDQAFKDGFLDLKIEEAKSASAGETFSSRLTSAQRKALESITHSVTAGAGRALVAILVQQLAVKVISPDQDVRLHKASKNGNGFSWQDGISMRSLDSKYVVPTLRRHDLLHINKFGSFMTRSFAENYPYTPFYKANMRGTTDTGNSASSKSPPPNAEDEEAGDEAEDAALLKTQQQWLKIIEAIEETTLDPEAALLYVLHLLWNQSVAFTRLAGELLKVVDDYLDKRRTLSAEEVVDVISRHIEASEFRARLLEVGMHALMQALEESGMDLDGDLKPLMPMRTANLKHGNLGDVEVLFGGRIVEAWDAKYDQPFVGDALSELEDKITGHDVTDMRFGYVVFPEKKAYPEVDHKIKEMLETFNFEVQVLTFKEWADEQIARGKGAGLIEEDISRAWLRAYGESLALKRREKAPIDEPTFDWIKTLIAVLA